MPIGVDELVGAGAPVRPALGDGPRRQRGDRLRDVGGVRRIVHRSLARLDRDDEVRGGASELIVQVRDGPRALRGGVVETAALQAIEDTDSAEGRADGSQHREEKHDPAEADDERGE